MIQGRLRLLPAATLIAGALVLTAPRHVNAYLDPDVNGTTTFTVDPAAGVVHVVVAITAGNHDPSTNRYPLGRPFEFSLEIPATAMNVTADAYGRDVPLHPQNHETGALVTYDVSSAFALKYGQSGDLAVRYDLTGKPPRDAGVARVAPDHFAFEARGFGDPGHAIVKVVVPTSMNAAVSGVPTTTAHEGDQTVYTTGNIADPERAVLYVSAQNELAMRTASISTTDAKFNLHAWTDDSEWAGFVTSAITDGVPVLEQLIGQPWPITDTIDVTESYTPYVYGYAGWFSATEHRIEIGERLDHEVILHELAHAWFNTNWFQERWLDEGFAQLYANLATTQLGHTPTTPQPATITTDDPGYLPLNTWSNPDLTTSNHDRETFGYNASWSVVQQITDDIGIDAMTSILDHINNHTPTYPGNNPNETTSTTTNWQRFLDLTENIGHSTIADSLMERWVVDNDQSRLLERRSRVRKTYEALVADSGDWAPPKLIRDEMAAWNFDDAERDITTAQSLIDLHHQLDTIADTAHLTYSPDLQTTYQDAATTTDLDQATNLLQNTLDTAHTLLDATHANNNSHGILGTIGLIGNDTDHTLTDARNALQRGDLTAARRGAQRISSATDGATKDGLTRLAIVLGIGTLAAAAVRWQRRKHTNTTPPGATAAGE